MEDDQWVTHSIVLDLDSFICSNRSALDRSALRYTDRGSPMYLHDSQYARTGRPANSARLEWRFVMNENWGFNILLSVLFGVKRGNVVEL